jgi:hypothetical protein
LRHSLGHGFGHPQPSASPHRQGGYLIDMAAARQNPRANFVKLMK